MNKLYTIIYNRNSILVLALILGFAIPAGGFYLAPYTLYLLTIVMSFSSTGIQLKMLTKFKSVSKVGLLSIFLNYIVHGAIILTLAYFLTDTYTYYGFVVIAATPPGAAIIPFTYFFKGDIDFSFKGMLGTYLSSIVLTPLIISFFVSGEYLPPSVLILLVVKVIIVPLIISRFLLIKKIKPITEKIRGQVVNIGFATIIYTAVAINSHLIINNFKIVAISAFILFVALFVAGVLFVLIFKKRIKSNQLISQNLMLTIKSSGFAIATAMVLFEQKEVAVPAAIMSIFVLLYLIFIDFFFQKLKITPSN